MKDDNVLERMMDACILDFFDESIGYIKEKTYIFLDEIQLVPRWSDIVKGYLD
ncbi:MAG: AAA family ATPase [Deltaproteobacteria bacterium]|nr:AAA family ATPase [Deltaproteobacteria bacterium]